MILDEDDMEDKGEKEMLEERREGQREREKERARGGRGVPDSNFGVGLFPRKKENMEKVG